MELVTSRLILREFREDDFDAIRIFESDPEVEWFEHGPYTEAETRYRLEGAIEWQAEVPRVRYKFAITVRPDDTARGRLSLTRFNPQTREWEIGWTVRRVDWGQGYATEAATAVADFAFRSLNAHRLIAFCNAGNTASIRVMQKLGMQQDGRLREGLWWHDAWSDELVYAVLDHEWNR